MNAPGNVPERGFPEAELRNRLARAQSAMAENGLAALFITTEPELRYFTGFLTRFWESPTRPWFLVVPVETEPVAVIPSIGAWLMAQCWISDIRTWRSPDYKDDGISLLAETLREIVPEGGRIGLRMDQESHLRMPISDWRQLRRTIGTRTFIGDQHILRRMRMIKSETEIAKIHHACSIADRAFARMGEIAAVGTPLSQVFRRFQMLCLEEGADWVPYLAGAAAKGGYGDVISPATDKPLAEKDVLMLDTGLVWDGYFCDFDRNFSLGKPSADLDTAHGRLIEAVEAAMQAARPGARTSDLFHAMDRVVTGGNGGLDAGRLGHGLGMQLTEWPSLIPQDSTVLEPGMVLTLEPLIETGKGRMLVHEENIVISETGAEFLSTPSRREIAILRGLP